MRGQTSEVLEVGMRNAAFDKLRRVKGGKIEVGSRDAEGGKNEAGSRNVEGGKIEVGSRNAEGGKNEVGSRNAEGGKNEGEKLRKWEKAGGETRSGKDGRIEVGKLRGWVT